MNSGDEDVRRSTESPNRKLCKKEWNPTQGINSNFELLGRMSRAPAMFAMQVKERRSPKLFRIAKDCSNCVVNHTPETSYLDGV